jgi:ferredoxin--NADP+ reductase
MSNLNSERILSVHHWNDTLFSFKCTRDPGLRFENGQFVMIGLQQESGRPLMRAYSIASPNWEEHLEFFSIKVPDGPLTSQLQHLKEGDEIIISKKPTGTLVLDDLNPGKHLYLLSTGTGLAPFMSVIQDPQTYERFDSLPGGDLSLVYCFGTLSGEWPDGKAFTSIRFIDRFEIVSGKIIRQDVWNDIAEMREQAAT